MFGAVAALALSGTAHAKAPVSENANRHFNEGVRYLSTQQADRYEKAYEELRAAYADTPYWKILGYLGMVAQVLERDGEAIDAYRGYLEQSGKELNTSERDQITGDLARLELGVATVTIQTAPAGAWIIDERLPAVGAPVINRYGPSDGSLTLRLRAGHHRIHAELGAAVSESWDLDASAGSRTSRTFELQRARVPSETPASANPEPFDDRLETGAASKVPRVLGYVSLGLGAVGVGSGIWFLTQASDWERTGNQQFEGCRQMSIDPCTADDEATEKEGQARTWALVSFIGAGAFVGAGVLLLLSAPSGDATQQATWSPWIGPGELGVSGRF
ncbi:MAG TPA: hypothetical protein VJU61_23525 [Polyangiaceae bacterium]|nr:hypothetical protein [Polyangiaceae bacterium]